MKVFKVILLFIVLSVGAIICVLRWDAWFYNIAESAYIVPNEPQHIMLTFGENASTDRTLSWRTDEDILSCRLMLISAEMHDTLILPASREVVETRAGNAAYYNVRMEGLLPGHYLYNIEYSYDESFEDESDNINTYSYFSEQYSFDVLPEENNFSFLLFGDIQDTEGDATRLLYSEAQKVAPDARFYAYVGDVVERPIDDYWSTWFAAADSAGVDLSKVVSMAVPGNHEYLKGLLKKIDTRWEHVFVNPLNAPSRFAGSTYYVDFPNMRMIMLDTDAMQLFSDYTVMMTWTKKVLHEAISENKWTIVLMHHPVYSAGMGRDNPLIYLSLKWVLNSADVVFAGHDHSYQRISNTFTDEDTDSTMVLTNEPVWSVVSASQKSYIPKCRIDADRLGANHIFFTNVQVSDSLLNIDTYAILTADSSALYDSYSLRRIAEDKYFKANGTFGLVPSIRFPKQMINHVDSLMPEMLEIPVKYKDRRDMLKVNRFVNRAARRRENFQ